jgi:hypothetical protein
MFALVCVGVLIARRGGLPPRAESAEPEATAPIATMATCAALLASFLAELQIVRIAALTQVPFPDWFGRLPLLFIDENPPLGGHTPPWVGNSLLALALAQSWLLYRLYRALRDRGATQRERVALVLACAGMLAFALATRQASAASDLYLNAGFAHLGVLGAYHPPGVPFAGDFALINKQWGVPLLPAAYGPLWIFVASTVVKAGTTLWQQVQLLRVFNAALFVACIALLRGLRRDSATVALFALNPALVFQFVLDAHNDLFPLTLALCALATVTRRPWLALLFAAAAGAAKLPFALVAALAFSRLEQRAQRISFALAAGTLAAAATLLGSRGAYLGALGPNLYYQAIHEPLGRFAHALAILAACFAAAAAIVSRRFFVTASWSFLSFGPIVLPWYAAWGLPYAILEGSFLPVYLFTLPVVAFDLSTGFGLTPFSRALYALIVVSPVLLLIAAMRGKLRPA